MNEKKVIFFENIYPYGLHIKREYSNSLELLGYETCFVGKGSDSAFFIPYKHHDYEAVFTLDDKNYKETEYKGMNLWELVRGNVGYECPSFFSSSDTKNYADLEKIYTKATHYIDFIDDLIYRHKPAGFVVWGGMFFESRIITRLARQSAIPCYAIEYSFDANRFYFDRKGVVGNSHAITDDWAEISRQDSLTDSQKEWLQDWIKNNYKGKCVNQPDQGISDEVRDFINITKAKVGLLLCQCFIDTVISMDSPNYRTTLDAYRSVIKECDALDMYLVVKVHPGDREEYKEKIRQLCQSRKNVLYIGDENDVNVYSLMDACDFGVTINSQAGLEMLAKGKNVLTLGNAFYGGMGFNVQLNRPPELREQIVATAKNAELQSTELALCYLFLYKLLRNYLVDLSQSVDVTAEQVRSILHHANNEELLSDQREIERQKTDDFSDKQNLRVVIVHPSPRVGGSGYYLQDLAKSLTGLGHKVLILSEGSCPPIDEGVRWRKIKFLGAMLDPDLKEIVKEFSPNVLLQVGVRTKPIRVALEIYFMCNPLFVMQAEDDELLAYQKHYKEPNPDLLEVLDRPLVFSQDVMRFMRMLDVSQTSNIWINPHKYRWVEPLMRILVHRMADQYCAIWEPMAARLRRRFGKHVDLLPPILDMSKVDTLALSETERSRVLNGLGVDPSSIVYFINGTVYDFSDDIELFVQAMRLYKKNATSPIAVLIGGNSRKDLAVITEGDERDVVYKVLGYLNDRAYIDIIKASDVICAPGKDDIFNRLRLSSRLVKGMVLGKPIFTFRAGLAESLNNGEHGFFTEIDTPYGWFHVLRQTEDKTKRNVVGDKGRQFALDNFDAMMVAERLASSWQKGLSRKRLGSNDMPGFVEPTDLRLRIQGIYDRHVPMKDRLLAGLNLESSSIKPYEFRPNIALLYGFSHAKKGRFQTRLDGIWVDRGVSSFMIAGDGCSIRTVSISIKYEEGVTDLDSDFKVYDQDGLLAHKIEIRDAHLEINFKTKSNILVVTKNSWRGARNNPSDKRRLYWMLRNIILY